MIKRLLDIISKIIIENIPFFIVLGILSLFNNSYVYLHEFKEILLKYILPITLCYSSGKLLDKRYGGLVSVVVLGAVLVSYNFQSFLEPIIIGIVSGWITQKYCEVVDKLKIPGAEMTFHNLGTALLAVGLSFGLHLLLPFYQKFQMSVSSELSSVVFDNSFLPLLSVVIEPAKVFFLNNLINHSLLSSLGFLELNEKGKSIFFLLETNPGPGLGLLLCYYIYEKKKKNTEKVKEARSNIFIHFLGGIHEVYFAYVLRNLKLIFALIAGGMSGVYFFQKFSVGLVGVASPGSVFLLLLLSPLEDKLHVLFGIMISAGVTFTMAFLIIKKNDIAFDTSDLNYSEAIILSNNRLEICVSCDAGMGSSAMGATLLRKKLTKEGIKNIKVVNSSIDSIPVTSNIIVVHRQLIDRMTIDTTGKDIFVIDDFMDSGFYDALAKKIKELSMVEEVEKPSIPTLKEVEEKMTKEENKSNEKRKILEKSNIHLDLKRTDKISAISNAGKILVENGYVEEAYIASMIEREMLSNTYLENGIAIPHCTADGLKYIKNSGIVVLQYPYGISYGNGKTVYLIVAIASLKDGHMSILKKLSEIFDDEKMAEQLSTTVEVDEIYESLLSLEEHDVK